GSSDHTSTSDVDMSSTPRRLGSWVCSASKASPSSPSASWAHSSRSSSSLCRFCTLASRLQLSASLHEDSRKSTRRAERRPVSGAGEQVRRTPAEEELSSGPFVYPHSLGGLPQTTRGGARKHPVYGHIG